MNIGWTPKSLRYFKRLIRKDPNLRPLIEQTLLQLSEDPFYPSLCTHKLKGELANVWSCSIDYNYRILFEFVDNPEDKQEAIYKKGEKYSFSGNRIKRGLYKSAEGVLINADVNGSLNILRKAIPNAFADGIKGIVVSPVKVKLSK